MAAGRIARTLIVAVVLTGAGGVAEAHGVWAHVHVTGWGVQALPDGELKDFLTSDPEVFNAVLFGAVFTDSGYSPIAENGDAAREYSEHLHWEPFVRDFVAWIRANDPPPWDDIESKKRVAFLMGCASHGMQDEVFDSLFLFQTKLHDGHGQDYADPAMDGFLNLDGRLEFFPTPYVPMDTMLELFDGLSHDVTAKVIQDAVDLITNVYVNDELGVLVTQALGEQYEPDMPWARQHYMDPEVPGSLASEVPVAAGYLQAMWARLHGDFDHDAPIIRTFPDDGGCVRGVDAGTPDPWVTMVYGIGVDRDSPIVTWTESGGDPLAFGLQGTRWGARWTRLNRLLPDVSLDPDGAYAVEVGPGLATIDGEVSTGSAKLSFSGTCGVGPADGLTDEDAAGGEVTAPDQGPGGTGCSAGAGTRGFPLAPLLLLSILILTSAGRPGRTED